MMLLEPVLKGPTHARYLLLKIRVARWFVFKPKTLIWVNFGGHWNGKCCYILRPFGQFSGRLVFLRSSGIFYDHLVYFSHFGMLGPRKIWQPCLRWIVLLRCFKVYLNEQWFLCGSVSCNAARHTVMISSILVARRHAKQSNTKPTVCINRPLRNIAYPYWSEWFCLCLILVPWGIILFVSCQQKEKLIFLKVRSPV
jgi:hypothetical protein